MILKPLTEKKNAQLVTGGIFNCRDSSKFKVCSPLQPSCNLIGLEPAVGYYSYTNR